MLTTNQILAGLPKLAPNDLKAIIATAQTLLAAQSGPHAAPAGTLAATAFDALSIALGATASPSMLPASLIKRFEGRLVDFKASLDRDFRGWDVNKIRQKAFLVRLFELLRDHLRTINVKPTYATMINTMPRMSEVFDAAFPDYRASGLAHLVLKHGSKLDQSDKEIAGKPKVKAVQGRQAPLA